jgi:inosose dehydratase
MIKIANAPCSWGALEFDLETEAPGFQQVLDEIKETGYIGTELGDWGFMPTDPQALKRELEDRDLSLLGAFVPVHFVQEAEHEAGVQAALKVAGLMHAAGFEEAFIVLADNNGTVPTRTQFAGQISPEMGLSAKEWDTFAAGVEKVADAVKKTYDMRCVFHHHCAGYVETPEELRQLMERTRPDLVGLCFDTGHYAYGGGDPMEGLRTWRDRIWHVHFKDFSSTVGEAAKAYGWDYFAAVQNGVFCELGKGAVNFEAAKGFLLETQYDGWIVVEQDVLPGMGSPKICAENNRQYLKTIGI